MLTEYFQVALHIDNEIDSRDGNTLYLTEPEMRAETDFWSYEQAGAHYFNSRRVALAAGVRFRDKLGLTQQFMNRHGGLVYVAGMRVYNSDPVVIQVHSVQQDARIIQRKQRNKTLRRA